MEKTISSVEAHQQFYDLLQEVSDEGDRIVVERDGVPTAVMVPFALYAQWKRRRERFFEQMHETSERANLSEADAIRLTDEVKDALRSRP
jgi:prevent-host-death family protein